LNPDGLEDIRRTETAIHDRLQAVEQALWGSTRDPDAGLVKSVRRVEDKQEETRRQNYMIMAGVVVAIVTPAATILLTRAAG
jgi:hypothetical protein